MSTVDYVVRASVTQPDYLVDETSVFVYKKTTTTSLTLDTKLVSSALGTVHEARTYEAKSEKSSSGVPGIYTSGNDSKRNTPFSDVARDVVNKAAVGLTARILAQGGAAGVKPSPAPQPPPSAPAAASAPQ